MIDEEELTDEEYGCMTCERSHPTKLKVDSFWRPIITFTQLFALAREVPSILSSSKEDREDNQSKFSTLQLLRELCQSPCREHVIWVMKRSFEIKQSLSLHFNAFMNNLSGRSDQLVAMGSGSCGIK
ncbi:hypothetical protein Tco_0061124 [Tanacetum coccineum]